MTGHSLDPGAEGAPPRIERCRGCGRAWLIRRGFCPHCGGAQTAMEDVSGLGRVEAFTAVHRAVQPSAIGPAPYGIALVTLDAEPEVRLMALAVETLAVGDRVRVSRHGEHGAPYLAKPAGQDGAPRFRDAGAAPGD